MTNVSLFYINNIVMNFAMNICSFYSLDFPIFINALHFNMYYGNTHAKSTRSPPCVAIMRALMSHCGVYYRPAKCLYVINTTALTFSTSHCVVMMPIENWEVNSSHHRAIKRSRIIFRIKKKNKINLYL